MHTIEINFFTGVSSAFWGIWYSCRYKKKSMWEIVKNLFTIDIFGDNHFEQYTKVREAYRGIVIKQDKILLTYEVNTDQWFIPGGGLEDDESVQECCVRELTEETG